MATKKTAVASKIAETIGKITSPVLRDAATRAVKTMAKTAAKSSAAADKGVLKVAAKRETANGVKAAKAPRSAAAKRADPAPGTKANPAVKAPVKKAAAPVVLRYKGHDIHLKRRSGDNLPVAVIEIGNVSDLTKLLAKMPKGATWLTNSKTLDIYNAFGAAIACIRVVGKAAEL